MKNSREALFGTMTLCLSLLAPSAGAEPPAPGRGPRPGPSAGVPPALTAPEAVRRYSLPDKNHKLLKSLAGSWDLTSRTWKGAPGPEPILTKGTAEKRMILGDRFIQEDYHSIFQGQPYTGQGITGFDTNKNRFVNTWICNLSTGVIVSEGVADSSGKELVMSGAAFDRSTQQNKTYRMSLHIESNDKHTITYYETGPDGKETKIVEVDYTRKR